MGRVSKFFRQHYSKFYKGILFLVSLLILVSFFPKEATFKYEYTRGRPWMHDDLIAPFDFAILKAPEDIEDERAEIYNNMELYFEFDIGINEEKRREFIEDFNLIWDVKYGENPENDYLRQITLDRGLKILSAIITRGVIQPISEIENKPPDYRITLIIQNIAEEARLGDLYTIHSAYEKINEMLAQSENVDREVLKTLLEDAITQNVFFNDRVTNAELQKQLDQISTSRGMVQEGERIISRGEVISKNKYQILESLRMEYETRLGGQ
ncbi:MAG: hypothetical protein ACOCX8_04495, partial [Bacteroidota bacterium]